MFTPAWKKEDPESVQKVLKKLPAAGTGKLKKIALEAFLEEVAAAAVVRLGAGTADTVTPKTGTKTGNESPKLMRRPLRETDAHY